MTKMIHVAVTAIVIGFAGLAPTGAYATIATPIQVKDAPTTIAESSHLVEIGYRRYYGGRIDTYRPNRRIDSLRPRGRIDSYRPYRGYYR